MVHLVHHNVKGRRHRKQLQLLRRLVEFEIEGGQLILHFVRIVEDQVLTLCEFFLQIDLRGVDSRHLTERFEHGSRSWPIHILVEVLHSDVEYVLLHLDLKAL